MILLTPKLLAHFLMELHCRHSTPPPPFLHPSHVPIFLYINRMILKRMKSVRKNVVLVSKTLMMMTMMTRRGEE